ncbi:hypothetical protein SEUCBS139899_005330 [Sporothrix eucalyptigena]
MRWKEKPAKKEVKDSFDEYGGRRDTRYRSRDYETDSDEGHDPVGDRQPRRRDDDYKGADNNEDDEATPKNTPKDSVANEAPPKTEEDRSRRRHHRRHRHHHRRHRTRDECSRSRSHSPASDDSHRERKRRRRQKKDEVEEEDPYADPPLDPDAAFRQSLFDAMADDEGAAYWEGVYGQPVHEYAEDYKTRQQQQAANDPDGLSAMNDEEYAEYVRQRMWERSQEGRREARKNQKKQQAAAAAAEKERIRAKMRAFEQERRHWAAVERSLRRGEARRQRRRWQDRWQTYTSSWTSWEASPSPETIPWPVARPTGDDKDSKIKEEDFAKEVRAFFTGGPQDDSDSSDHKTKPTTEAGLLTRLRDERVRWHPDKMQQRLGGSVHAGVMRDITAIFQVVDHLWGELRGKKK